MCGIAGAVAINGELDPAIARALPMMTGAIAHRGPDGDGHHVSTRAALGHRRLAIIDVVSGAQPMTNEDGTVWIVFNGEVYNHHALRKELEAKGHVFRTRCDTEAILHAFEEFGPACAAKLEGMFAFAIHDQKTGELFMARDRLGKKPLFYAQLGGALHFSSEIKSLRQSPAWDDTIDATALQGFLNLGYILAPNSVYAHVKKLEPGHSLHLRDGRITIRQYWDVTEFDSDTRDEAAIVAELEELLRRAVHERLESDVPLGAFLSSGIDSGLVVSFMSEVLGANILTATVGFGQKTHNEVPGAALVAKRFNTRHETEIIEPQLDEVFDSIVGAFDEPFADDSAIPTYYVSQMARRHVTVALSGDGGDESFGGYDFRYVPHAWECRLRSLLPGRPGRALMRWLGAHWPRGSSLPKALRLSTIFENLGREAEEAYYFDMCFIKPVDVQLLLGRDPTRDPRDSPVYERVVTPYRRCPSSSPLQKAQYGDLKTYLPNMPLVKVDRMSMLHSLEIRCPLLDRRVVEFAFRVPTRTKLPKLQPKHLLKQLGRRRLPGELLTLPKQGFSAPIGQWIKGEFAERYRDEVLSPNSKVSTWLHRDCLVRFFEEHRRGAVSRPWPLWTAWALERWSRLSRTPLAGAAGASGSGAACGVAGVGLAGGGRGPGGKAEIGAGASSGGGGET